MLHMRRVGNKHGLYLCLDTDRTVLTKNDDPEQKPLFYFDHDLYGATPEGKRVCKIGLTGDRWYLKAGDHGIEVPAQDFNKAESVYEVEKDFLVKWLELQGVEA